MITSLQNARIKDAAKLRDARRRAQTGTIIIDGAREIVRAVRGGARLIEVFYSQEMAEDDLPRQALELAAFASAELVPVSTAVLEKLAYGERAGLVAIAYAPRVALDALVLPPVPLIAVVEGVEKPGNVGAMLRSADAAGVSALIAANLQTDLFNPNAIRASLGTVFTLPVAVASSQDTLAWLRRRQIRMYAARVDGAALYTEVDFQCPAAIVLGSEAQGLSPAWRGDDIQAVRLPLLGAADSLNVSATAAVLFYEALRQRSAKVG